MSQVIDEQKGNGKTEFVNVELVKGSDVNSIKIDLAAAHPWKGFSDAVAQLFKTEHFYHYKDDEGDLCAVSRIEELREAARLASKKKAPVRLLLTPVGDVPNAEYLQILQDKDDFLEAMESDEDNFVEAPVEGQQEGQPASLKKLDATVESKAKLAPISDQAAQASIPVPVAVQSVQQQPVVPVQQQVQQQPVVPSPSPSTSSLASPQSPITPVPETAIAPLAKGGRLIVTTEDLRVMGGVITSVQGRSITILLDAEDAVEGQPHRASVSVSAAPGESKDKEFKHDAAHMQEGKRKAALPLFQQLKNALILEAQLIKKDLSETNFRMVWKEMLNELKLVYLDIARVFGRKKPAALAAPAPAPESKKDAPVYSLVETKKESPSSAVESKHTPPPPPPRKSSGENKQTVPLSYLLPAETNGDLPSPPTAINPALGLSQQQQHGSGSTKFDYQLELDLLVDMGYKDLNALRELLNAAKGSVPLVITWLVSKGA